MQRRRPRITRRLNSIVGGRGLASVWRVQLRVAWFGSETLWVSGPFTSMENIAIARLLEETAALLEIDAADPFRIRSYRRAAEAVEQQTTQLAVLVSSDPKALLAIPGIGKGMAANICELVATG